MGHFWLLLGNVFNPKKDPKPVRSKEPGKSDKERL